ncbi:MULTISPECIES: PIN domain-containing protein [unclassified Mesorhizobium]|uniref:PIN domain-containing protein n=1 Tax=unclassified Mesorhizobium TaxID=325217 RepID=UPI000FCB68C1|nr:MULTISPECIES: PIN domain-containing protein [unclassified Mesorhizobium]TGP21380.1 type II toxin-antitoxin system VapC family toxin [Mesorhizobium sp. M1D.F.Ca.ET.231.01.1.1]TGP28826.1 type II toxin-antitoxin system VapC family toxin [Mesorhizobium sp. M1D.F.Ca.ET.234.01.1.1]TGS43294.1 type II toxin-antitoxin system VapC family toxin [Mesorhizobium sp. M1D.F.Ca.ET.184.01.1.1]TGS59842.1 type II toxin-antitoxin system VapC family toxin [Mesorhizobium sp. M1D.F.Ca.ET.183.01.1.1]
MASLYLLDTNILIAAMKGRPEVRKRLEAQQISAIRLSAIVMGELEFGAEKSAYGDRNRARLATLTQRLPLVGIDQDTIRHYAKIRAFLERHGTPIGANDTWIAAQALAINAVLVTDNEREFFRVPGLVVENWLTDTES